jgi:hypothetical protein
VKRNKEKFGERKEIENCVKFQNRLPVQFQKEATLNNLFAKTALAGSHERLAILAMFRIVP